MTFDVSVVLAILAVAAFAGPLIGELLGVPGAVVELVMGLGLAIVVPARLTSSQSVIATLGQMGFLILMFLVGLEFDLRQIWRASRDNLVAGVGLFGVSLGLSSLLIGHLAGASSLWVLAGAATSVGVTVPVLHVHGWMGGRYASDVLMVGAVAEIVYLLALNALSVANGHDSLITTALLGARAVVLIVFTIVAVTLLHRARRRVPHHFHRWFLRDDPIEVGLRGTFALLFVVVAVVGLDHIPTVLGALLAGVIFRAVMGNAKAITSRLTSLANSFFIPLFFLTVGLQTHLHSNVVGLVPIIALVLATISVPRLILAPYMRWRGYRWRLALAASTSLMAPLTLLIATAEIGRTSGLLGARTAGALIVTAATSAIIFPIVTKRLLPYHDNERLEQPAPTKLPTNATRSTPSTSS
jgi:CPA2 family monovalent cation:H+ antiporter-2